MGVMGDGGAGGVWRVGSVEIMAGVNEGAVLMNRIEFSWRWIARTSDSAVALQLRN